MIPSGELEAAEILNAKQRDWKPKQAWLMALKLHAPFGFLVVQEGTGIPVWEVVLVMNWPTGIRVRSLATEVGALQAAKAAVEGDLLREWLKEWDNRIPANWGEPT